MAKTTIVHFTQDGPRILKGENAKAWAGRSDALINPTIPRGVPPHLWVRVGNEIGVPPGITAPASIPKLTLTRRIREFSGTWLGLGIIVGALLRHLYG